MGGNGRVEFRLVSGCRDVGMVWRGRVCVWAD